MNDAQQTATEASPQHGYRKGRRRRAQILDRMIKMVASRGMDGSSMRSVADALGVTHAALRHYFPSRDELLVATYREHDARETSGIGNAGPAVVQMQDSAARNRSVPGLVELYTNLASDALQGGHPATRDFMRERFRWLRSEVTALVEADQAAGRIRADLDARSIAMLLIAVSDGLQTQWLLDPQTVDTERGLQLFSRLFAAGAAPTR